MKPVIKCQNLSVAYTLGKTSEFWALRNINLEIYPEEYVVFFGPSGCGKSTLLYSLAGLEVPTQGEISVYGKKIIDFNPKEMVNHRRLNVGMIFQAYNLIPTLKVLDNVLLPNIFGGLISEASSKRAKLLLKKFQIEKFANRYPSELSGGQQQRVAIARSLIYNPPILFADEPVGNLDSKTAEVVLNLIQELNQKHKKTIIMVTHNPQHLHYANRVFYMKDGEIIREVVNTKNPTPSLKKRKISELEKLTQAYPHLAESRLRAKLISHYLLLPYDIETQEGIEKVIEKYLLGKINDEELFETLDNPPINLYTSKAKNLTKKIAPLVAEIKALNKEENPQNTHAQEKVIMIRKHLLDTYSGKVSLEQVKRIEESLAQRLVEKIDRKKLEKFFDLSLIKGGAGLNKRTAKRFAREVELVLMRNK